MKKFLSILYLVLIMSTIVFADSNHDDFSEAQSIIEQRIPYEDLTDDQFELLGDYFMDQMTGENHDYMDQMMGGEGSAELRQVHINMGKNMYPYYLENGELPAQAMPMMGSYGMMGTDTSNDIGWGHMMYPGYGNMFWGFGFFGVVIMVLFWGAVIWIIYWVVQKSKPKKKQNALKILKERYAKGEISKKEFEKRKKEIM